MEEDGINFVEDAEKDVVEPGRVEDDRLPADEDSFEVEA